MIPVYYTAGCEITEKSEAAFTASFVCSGRSHVTNFRHHIFTFLWFGFCPHGDTKMCHVRFHMFLLQGSNNKSNQRTAPDFTRWFGSRRPLCLNPVLPLVHLCSTLCFDRVVLWNTRFQLIDHILNLSLQLEMTLYHTHEPNIRHNVKDWKCAVLASKLASIGLDSIGRRYFFAVVHHRL